MIKNTNLDRLSKKILTGTKKAVEKLIYETKKSDGFLVFERGGKVVKIKAKSLK